jgi:hypothetical protein
VEQQNHVGTEKQLNLTKNKAKNRTDIIKEIKEIITECL